MNLLVFAAGALVGAAGATTLRVILEPEALIRCVWLELLNRLLLQWFFVRVVRHIDGETGRTIRWSVCRWIYPTSGSRYFRYVFVHASLHDGGAS